VQAFLQVLSSQPQHHMLPQVVAVKQLHASGQRSHVQGLVEGVLLHSQHARQAQQMQQQPLAQMQAQQEQPAQQQPEPELGPPEEQHGNEQAQQQQQQPAEQTQMQAQQQAVPPQGAAPNAGKRRSRESDGVQEGEERREENNGAVAVERPLSPASQAGAPGKRQRVSVAGQEPGETPLPAAMQQAPQQPPQQPPQQWEASAAGGLAVSAVAGTAGMEAGTAEAPALHVGAAEAWVDAQHAVPAGAPAAPAGGGTALAGGGSGPPAAPPAPAGVHIAAPAGAVVVEDSSLDAGWLADGPRALAELEPLLLDCGVHTSTAQVWQGDWGCVRT